MTEIITWLSDHIVTIAAFVTAVGVIYKTCGKPIKSVVDKVNSLDGDMADMLWDRLAQGHDYYVKRGWASTDDKMRMVTIHEHYKSKGRNHLADSFEQDILKLPNEPPVKEE